MVGTGGKILAVDLQPKMISALQKRVARAGLMDRIEGRVCDSESLRIADCANKIYFTLIFAVAHVRGGGELGRPWYEHGKLLEKRNTFTDFASVGRHLVDTGTTRPENMVAYGGSAGGLLMGAVANMAPDLFAGILATVPFVDPLTTILDPSLPLTVTEWDEWGNPLEDPEVYAYMKSYSPYENVESRNYPAILAMTSLNDTRVYYVEPAKWVAALRHAQTDPAADAVKVLLKTEMNAGHGGISGRYERWKETAFQFAWLLDAAKAGHDGGA